MPRLINRGAVAVPSSASSSTALPEYEPPSCPLNEEARRGLGELANNRGTRVYEAQLKDAVRYLGLSVSDLNERLVAQSDRLDAMRGRRQERGSEKTDEEERLEAHLVDFEGQVDTLTRDAERAVRDVIDKKAELADESAALTELYNAAVSQHVDALAQHRRRLHAAAAAQDGDDGNGNGRDEEAATTRATTTTTTILPWRARCSA
ncbi:hypothetical protein HIM_01995 [Hirsutella minnesotensis 3608]|nr:hypothetical protein HIM_01995 [Hirsutella minnesotensis 3608]